MAAEASRKRTTDNRIAREQYSLVKGKSKEELITYQKQYAKYLPVSTQLKLQKLIDPKSDQAKVTVASFKSQVAHPAFSSLGTTEPGKLLVMARTQKELYGWTDLQLKQVEESIYTAADKAEGVQTKQDIQTNEDRYTDAYGNLDIYKQFPDVKMLQQQLTTDRNEGKIGSNFKKSFEAKVVKDYATKQTDAAIIDIYGIQRKIVMDEMSLDQVNEALAPYRDSGNKHIVAAVRRTEDQAKHQDTRLADREAADLKAGLRDQQKLNHSNMMSRHIENNTEPTYHEITQAFEFGEIGVPERNKELKRYRTRNKKVIEEQQNQVRASQLFNGTLEYNPGDTLHKKALNTAVANIRGSDPKTHARQYTKLVQNVRRYPTALTNVLQTTLDAPSPGTDAHEAIELVRGIRQSVSPTIGHNVKGDAGKILNEALKGLDNRVPMEMAYDYAKQIVADKREDASNVSVQDMMDMHDEEITEKATELWESISDKENIFLPSKSPTSKTKRDFLNFYNYRLKMLWDQSPIDNRDTMYTQVEAEVSQHFGHDPMAGGSGFTAFPLSKMLQSDEPNRKVSYKAVMEEVQHSAKGLKTASGQDIPSKAWVVLIPNANTKSTYGNVGVEYNLGYTHPDYPGSVVKLFHQGARARWAYTPELHERLRAEYITKLRKPNIPSDAPNPGHYPAKLGMGAIAESFRKFKEKRDIAATKPIGINVPPKYGPNFFDPQGF